MQQLKPFLSVLFIISTLIGLIFVKMEERRMSYTVLTQSHEYKKVREVTKQKEITLAKLTRPQLVENLATKKLTLKRVTPAQIIHLTELHDVQPAPIKSPRVALSDFFPPSSKVNP